MMSSTSLPALVHVALARTARSSRSPLMHDLTVPDVSAKIPRVLIGHGTSAAKSYAHFRQDREEALLRSSP